MSLPTWPGSRALVTEPVSPVFDLDRAIGQRQGTFRFELANGVTGQRLGDLHPLRSAVIDWDSGRIIKSTLRLGLGKADTAAINPLTDRISPYMVLPGDTAYPNGRPLGRFMFVDTPKQLTTAGQLGLQIQLNDEMFLVDQEIIEGINGVGSKVDAVIGMAVSGLPVTVRLEASDLNCAEAWGAGTGRGGILEALSISGDYWSPWFDHAGDLRFVRTFDPALAVPDLNLDLNPRVFRDSIVETDDLITAPNTFVVISNAASNPDVPVVGVASVPPTAPNSVANRGFALTRTLQLQLADQAQATLVAQGLAQRQTVFERVNLTTPPDPRYDGYKVVRFNGENWLSLAWSMPLIEGGAMAHTMRRSYRP